MEKAKDLLYEISDLLLACMIILVMSITINWKISDSLSYDTTFSNSVIKNKETTKNKETSLDSNNQQKPSSIDINISSGVSTQEIGEVLKSQDLIKNTDDFVHRVEELQLSSKLRSGTFSLKTDSSLDDIIYTLTGQEK